MKKRGVMQAVMNKQTFKTEKTRCFPLCVMQLTTQLTVGRVDVWCVFQLTLELVGTLGRDWTTSNYLGPFSVLHFVPHDLLPSQYRSQFSLNTAIFPFVSNILWHLSITNQSKTTIHISANYVIYYQKINQVKTCNLCPKI